MADDLSELLFLMKMTRLNLRAAVAAHNLSVQHIQRLRRLRGGWTPAQVSPFAWYDAQDATTITHVANAVSQWADKSGNARHVTQGTGAAKPTYTASAINGEAALSFDGGDGLSNTSFTLTGEDLAVFAVATRDSSLGDNKRLVSLKGAGALDWNTVKGCLALSSYTGAPADGFRVYFNSASPGTAIELAANTPALMASTWDGASVQFWKDGTAPGTATGAAVTAFDTNTLGLGFHAETGDENYWNGLVGEVIILDALPSTGNRQKIEGYLAHKWGLEANLPSDHPYKTAAP